ncbi:MAG: hypothetical protein M0C28_07510 [Candidatus Moduliflexus flocculans]|nr:hypothetical protein [Candidatus Moduliflexus flocculans]
MVSQQNLSSAFFGKKNTTILRNIKIEKEYWDNVLTDSTVYTYTGDLLVKEIHYDIVDSEYWGDLYEYDANDHLIKRTILPEGDYTVFQYDNAATSKALHYNKEDLLQFEQVYVRTMMNSREITTICYKYGPYLGDITEKDYH